MTTKKTSIPEVDIEIDQEKGKILRPIHILYYLLFIFSIIDNSLSICS